MRRTLAVCSSTTFVLKLRHTRVHIALTHVDITDIQSLVFSILRAGIYLAHDNVVSWGEKLSRKMPSEIVRMCHGGDWVDNTCSMHFLTYGLSFYTFCLAYHVIYMFLLR